MNGYNVAPLAGVWIEILSVEDALLDPSCRSPCGSVV